MPNRSLFPEEPVIIETITCGDLDPLIADLIDDKDYRLFSIFPADSPRWAILERGGSFIKLEKKPDEEQARAGEHARDRILISRSEGSVWHEGRAGMRYRDLIPGRMGGKLIASHISIPEVGPVPDYVHFHKVDFQVILCIKGWCELVYEDQGPPFLFEQGDCVLQPPGIRHRVLRCSDGFEVVEISSPAEHPTYAEHGFDLPTRLRNPERTFEGQRFVHARSSERSPEITSEGIESTSVGLGHASRGQVDAVYFRAIERMDSTVNISRSRSALMFVVEGVVTVSEGDTLESLEKGDSLTSTGYPVYLRSADKGAQWILASF